MMSIKAILGKCFQLILPLRRDWTCLFSNYPMDKYLFKSQDEDTHTTPMEADLASLLLTLNTYLGHG